MSYWIAQAKSQAALLLLLLSVCRTAAQSVNATIKVYKIGNNREPEKVYPLPECAGDCDEDDDVRDSMFYCLCSLLQLQLTR